MSGGSGSCVSSCPIWPSCPLSCRTSSWRSDVRDDSHQSYRSRHRQSQTDSLAEDSRLEALEFQFALVVFLQVASALVVPTGLPSVPTRFASTRLAVPSSHRGGVSRLFPSRRREREQSKRMKMMTCLRDDWSVMEERHPKRYARDVVSKFCSRRKLRPPQ